MYPRMMVICSRNRFTFYILFQNYFRKVILLGVLMCRSLVLIGGEFLVGIFQFWLYSSRKITWVGFNFMSSRPQFARIYSSFFRIHKSSIILLKDFFLFHYRWVDHIFKIHSRTCMYARCKYFLNVEQKWSKFHELAKRTCKTFGNLMKLSG